MSPSKARKISLNYTYLSLVWAPPSSGVSSGGGGGSGASSGGASEGGSGIPGAGADLPIPSLKGRNFGNPTAHSKFQSVTITRK